jgi:hypothetical protein
MTVRKGAVLVALLTAQAIVAQALAQEPPRGTTRLNSNDASVEARLWRIEVLSETDRQVGFEAAIAHDDNLELVRGSTPYTFEFLGRSVTALFEAEERGLLRVYYYHVDPQGQFQRQGGFGGRRTGRLSVNLDDPRYDRFHAGLF